MGDTQLFSNFIALVGILAVVANAWGSFLVRQLGIRRFTKLTTFLSLFPSLGGAIFGYRGSLVGYGLGGFLALAQSLGISAALVAEGGREGIPTGELAGERASLSALLKIVGPLWYSMLYVQGKRWWNSPTLPLFFNAGLGVAAFWMSNFYL